MKKVVVAIDSFKGSLNTFQAGNAIKENKLIELSKMFAVDIVNLCADYGVYHEQKQKENKNDSKRYQICREDEALYAVVALADTAACAGNCRHVCHFGKSGMLHDSADNYLCSSLLAALCRKPEGYFGRSGNFCNSLWSDPEKAVKEFPHSICLNG